MIIIEMDEDKKVVDPTLAGFYEAIERTNVEKITYEMLAGLSRIPAAVTVSMWRVIMKMSKIGRGGQVILFLESPLLDKYRLKQ